VGSARRPLLVFRVVLPLAHVDLKISWCQSDVLPPTGDRVIMEAVGSTCSPLFSCVIGFMFIIWYWVGRSERPRSVAILLHSGVLRNNDGVLPPHVLACKFVISQCWGCNNRFLTYICRAFYEINNNLEHRKYKTEKPWRIRFTNVCYFVGVVIILF
jgi:hypothetical protein